MRSYVVLDLETTGLNPKYDRILEIGALKIEEEEIVGTFQKLINPQMQIPYRVQELTGITQVMAEEGEDMDTSVKEFLDFCGDCPLLGHNVIFDYSFVKFKAVNMGYQFEKMAVDTLKIARTALPGLPSRRLTSLCEHYQIDQEQAHRALDDATNTWKLYQRLKTEFAKVHPELFVPKQLNYQVKKQSPITTSQKVYLNDLIKYHRIDTNIEMGRLTKSEASKMIDRIILTYGRIMR